MFQWWICCLNININTNRNKEDYQGEEEEDEDDDDYYNDDDDDDDMEDDDTGYSEWNLFQSVFFYNFFRLHKLPTFLYY